MANKCCVLCYFVMLRKYHADLFNEDIENVAAICFEHGYKEISDKELTGHICDHFAATDEIQLVTTY